MTELEILEQLQRETGLVAPLADKDEQVRRIAQFTRRAATALREHGYGNVRKTGGANVEGRSIDKLIHRTTGNVIDIIAGSDGDNPRVAWQHVDVLDPTVFFLEPDPPAPGTGGNGNTGGGGQEEEPDELVEGLNSLIDVLEKTAGVGQMLVDAVRAQNAQIAGLSQHVAALDARLEELRRDGVRLRLM